MFMYYTLLAEKDTHTCIALYYYVCTTNSASRYGHCLFINDIISIINEKLQHKDFSWLIKTILDDGNVTTFCLIKS